ncbi:MAG: glycosyltransferase family 39 protein [Acidobacteriota bacterium]|nr:glycosyltransferase family 39 protein [Acidobacteriota bacterium]
MMRAKHLIAACVLLAGFLWLTRPMISAGPYSYDEADYMYAAGRGFTANYLDTPAQSFVVFLRTGLSRGKDASQKTALSQLIRDSGDINFYRHWHGPLYYYWLVLLQPWKGDEHAVRALSMIFPALAMLVIYFGSVWAFAGESAQSGGFLAAALYGWSIVTTGSTELAPHELFALIFVAALFLLTRFLDSGRRGCWYLAVVLSALAIATLEVGLILVLTLSGLAFWNRERIGADWRFARNSLALLVLSVLVVWPGALLKMAIAKAWLFMAFLAVVRKAAWGATFSQAWTARGLLAPVEWLLFAIALFLLLRDREENERRALPFLIFGLLMLLFLVRVNAEGARYMLPFLPAFDVFAAVTVVSWLKRHRIKAPLGMIAAACALVVLNTLRIEDARTHRAPDPRPSELLAAIRARHLEDKTVLIPHDDFPMLHYYFPQAKFIAYGENSDGPPGGVAADALVSQGDPISIVTY